MLLWRGGDRSLCHLLAGKLQLDCGRRHSEAGVNGPDCRSTQAARHDGTLWVSWGSDSESAELKSEKAFQFRSRRYGPLSLI